MNALQKILRSWLCAGSVDLKDKQFTETSTQPYDRHHYRVWFSDGSFKDAESYDDAQRIWYASPIKPNTIEVTQPRKRHGAKGFE